MKLEKFEQLAESAEKLYSEKPGLYKATLISMVAGGYLYVLTILGVLLALLTLVILGCIYGKHVEAGLIKIGIFLLVIIWVIARSLWVKIEPPAGIKISKKDAPGLFALVDEVCRGIRAPKADVVLIGYDVNACVSQVPRLGFLGWHKNYLLIGLPLMQAVTPDQLKAIIAHEFGHLSGEHGKFSVWAYRISATWGTVAATFDQRKSFMRFLFVPIYKWFVPRFQAVSLVLTRHQEYEADRLAASLTSPESIISSLVRLHVFGDAMSERYWRDYYRKVNSEPKPYAPFSAIPSFIRGFNDKEAAELSVKRALLEDLEGGMTHPPLAYRAASVFGTTIGDIRSKASQLIASALPMDISAAEHYLGPQLKTMTDRADAEFTGNLKPTWKQRHEDVTKKKSRLEQLAAMTAIAPLGELEKWEQASLLEEIDDDDKALECYQTILHDKPDDPNALFAVGRLLLEKKHDSGLPLLHKAMEKDSQTKFAGSHLLSQYYYKIGNITESKKWRFATDNEYENYEKCEEERSILLDADKFLQHDLTLGEIETFKVQFSAIGETAHKNFSIYLVRKKVRFHPEKPVYILAVIPKIPVFKYSDSASMDKKDEELVNSVMKVFRPSQDVRVFVIRSGSLPGKIKRVKNSLIYERK